MPRTSKTANVLKMLKLSDLPEPKPVPETPAPEIPPEPEPETALPPKKRRKNITKNLKIEKLSELSAENPAFAVLPQAPAPVAENKPRLYSRVSDERQIISVPLMLINEQLGAAVERFNVCACNECLRIMTDKALDIMPPMYVRVVNSADEDEVNRLITERRAEAIRALAKICIMASKKPFHDN